MGRGQGEQDFNPLYSGINAMRSAKLAPRGLKRGFVEDKEAWKKQEAEYINGVISELEAATREFASSDENWREYLRLYAATPNYAPTNVLWAQAQLRHRGIEGGVVFSESAWRILGRRVKAEYARPDHRRDKRFGYDREREWDDKYAVEMTQPLGHPGFMKTLEDANGNPLLDANGDVRKIFIPLEPKGFKAFVAYHEDATEALDGSPAPPLPSAPWAEAEGSDEDAGRLLDDIVEKIAPGEGLTISFEGLYTETDSRGMTRMEAARYWPGTQTIIVDPLVSKAEQATAALRELFIARAANRGGKETDESRRRHKAAAESAMYAIATLYKLDSKQQSFSNLADIAEEEKGLRKLSSEIHGHVSSVLGYLDPRTRALTHERANSQRSRAEKAKKQRKSKKRSARKAPTKAAAAAIA